MNISAAVEEVAGMFKLRVVPISGGTPQELAYAESAVRTLGQMSRAQMIEAPHLPQIVYPGGYCTVPVGTAAVPVLWVLPLGTVGYCGYYGYCGYCTGCSDSWVLPQYPWVLQGTVGTVGTAGYWVLWVLHWVLWVLQGVQKVRALSTVRNTYRN